MNRVWSSFLVFALVLAIVPAAFAQMTGGLPVGDTAPDGNVTLLTTPVPAKLSDIQAGKVLLLEMFLTTCPHCQAAVKEFNTVFAGVDAKKVAMISVGLQANSTGIREFVKKWGVKYPVAGDPNGKLIRPFNLQAVPSYFVLDAKRVIRFEGNAAPAAKMLSEVNSLVTTPPATTP